VTSASSADAARRLAQDADWQRFVHDSNGLLCGISPAYRFPDPLRRLLAAAYQTCTFPGCPVPAGDCDIDHLTPWKPDHQGGPTHLGNGEPLNRRHHNDVTHAGWDSARDPGTGNITWTSPLGQTATTRPHDYRPLSEQDPPPEPQPPPF